jgi:hypothetical protein
MLVDPYSTLFSLLVRYNVEVLRLFILAAWVFLRSPAILEVSSSFSHLKLQLKSVCIYINPFVECSRGTTFKHIEIARPSDFQTTDAYVCQKKSELAWALL